MIDQGIINVKEKSAIPFLIEPFKVQSVDGAYGVRREKGVLPLLPSLYRFFHNFSSPLLRLVRSFPISSINVLISLNSRYTEAKRT